jgi:uncharacterized membrane protein
MGASFARPELSASSFVQFQQIVHVQFVRMMPLLLVGAILASLTWLLSIGRRRRGTEFWLIAVATAALAFIFALTWAVNVPINDQLMTWSIAAPPTNVRELWAPWEQAHTVRTIVALGAFLLEVIALGMAIPTAGRE